MTNQMVLIFISVLYAVSVIYCAIPRRSSDRKLVCLPKALFWIGAVAGGVFLAIAWIAADQDGSVGLTVCFGLFVLLGILLMLGWRNCFVAYDKNGFTQHNLIGMQRSFTYDQVTGWRMEKHNPMESTLYAAGKKISFNMMSENGADFLAVFSAGYRRTHGNRKIPEVSGLRKDKGGFRAHVHNPGEYLFVFIMVMVLMGGMAGWLVLDTWLPVNEKDGEQFTLTFLSWEIHEEELVMTTPRHPEQFHISGYQDYLSGFDRLTEKCDGTTPFEVWAEHVTPDDSDHFYRVLAISSEGEVYRSFEDSTAYNREFMPYALGFFGICIAVLLVPFVLIYIVGSHPERFPKWVVYACFKKDAIDF